MFVEIREVGESALLGLILNLGNMWFIAKFNGLIKENILRF